MQSFLLLPLSFKVAVWTIVCLRKDGACHIVGYRLPCGRGRASSPILSFDHASTRAIISTGNRYVLVGDPFEDVLDDPVVVVWLAAHGLYRHAVEAVGIDDLRAFPCRVSSVPTRGGTDEEPR